MTSRLKRLDERYHFHHARRQAFVFGADERAGLISALVGGKGNAILDLGCRTGALTQHYARGNWVVGVDVDRSALEVAKERLGIETVWADVEDELPFANESFDVVVAGEVLEHLADPAAAVQHVERVLKARWTIRGLGAERVPPEEPAPVRRRQAPGDGRYAPAALHAGRTGGVVRGLRRRHRQIRRRSLRPLASAPDGARPGLQRAEACAGLHGGRRLLST